MNISPKKIVLGLHLLLALLSITYSAVGENAIQNQPSSDKSFNNIFKDHAQLIGMNLSGLDLSGAHLNQSNMQGSDLRRTNLCGSFLGRDSAIGCYLYILFIYATRGVAKWEKEVQSLDS